MAEEQEGDRQQAGRVKKPELAEWRAGRERERVLKKNRMGWVAGQTARQGGHVVQGRQGHADHGQGGKS